MQTIKHFFKTHPHAWWGAYLPIYLAMFFTIEHFITDNYWATQTSLDAKIPFCEWFIFPYVSWSPLLVVLGLYLILKDGEGFRRYMWFIMVTFTTAVVFCILIPNGQDLRPAVMAHHSRMVENMFHLVADKATALSERVEVLSRRSIRDKLLCYFSLLAARAGGSGFSLPFSLSALADYISADRSAMMRELKKMREEHLLALDGRAVTLYAGI